MATIINPEQRLNDESTPNTLNAVFARNIVLNWEVIAYIVIFFLAIFTRFYLLGERTMSHDESLHTVYSRNLYKDGFFQHSPLMHGPILFHITALNYWLFGVNDFTSRIYPAVLGVLITMFPVLFKRWIGRTGAVLASIMLLISPLMMYYSRYIRHDMPSILSGMVMFYAAMMYISGPPSQRRRFHWLYILSAAMIWNLGSKETSFIYIAIFGAFLTLYWVTRMIQHFFQIPGKMLFYTSIIGILLAGVAALGMIVIYSIALQEQASLADRLSYIGENIGFLFSGDPVSLGFYSFVSWTGMIFVIMLSLIILPGIWAYKKGELHFSILDALMALFVVLIGASLTILLSSRTSQLINEIEVVNNTAGIALAVGIIVSLSLTLIYAANRIGIIFSFRRHLLVVLVIMLVLCLGFILVEELSQVPSRADETAAPIVPGQDGDVVIEESDFTYAPLAASWIIGIVSIGFVIYTKRRGWWDLLENFPEFEVCMIMGSLILPWLTAVFIVATHGSPQDFTSIGESIGRLGNLVPVTGTEQVGQFVVGFLAWLPMMATAIVAGLAWNWRQWLICSVIFHGIFAFFFTTVFTNIEGLASGMIYSLQYWLEQQGVKRGSQPQYYYLLVIMPIYEFLPILGSFLAMLAGMVFFWRKRRERDIELLDVPENELEELIPAGIVSDEVSDSSSVPVEISSEWQLNDVPFLLFVSWWGVFNLMLFTLAGEKMPWLGTHLTVPLILLSGWYFGRVIEQIDFRKFMDRGWLYLLLLPFLFVGIFQVFAPYLGGQAPFQGTNQVFLRWTYQWLGVIGISGGIAYFTYRLTGHTGWYHLRQMIALVSFTILAVITMRSAWMASFIHYDEATEFLVYAHAAPSNKVLTEELADLSYRITDGMDMRVIHDNKFSWPGSWYLRDFTNSLYVGANAPTLQQLDDAVAVLVGDENRSKFEPLLEDSFQRFEHIRMWWPIQDYFALNAARVASFVDFEDPHSAQVRRGVFDIWWARDYSTYGDAVGKNITLTNWPVSDRVYLYVRKDYAAQVWPYGVGDGTALTEFGQVEVNACAANWQQRSAVLAFDTSSHFLSGPLGMSVSPDGRIFVAEESGRQISVFDADGRFLSAFGEPGTGAQEGAYFERPHSVAIADDGSVYVVDTWNYKVRSFTSNLIPITSWGQQITAGFDAQTNPVDGFWGPRDIAVDSQGRVYVVDTGNKRVRVYTTTGNFIRDIGSGGAGDGQINEPAGIALHPDGRVFIADTWNRRVAVFNQDGFFLQNIKVRGWYDELGNRPYLAIDPERNLLYVTDPDAGRILVYDTNGNCLSSFGQLNREAPNNSEFVTVGGIAVDEEGFVYVSDLARGRVLKFEPYQLPQIIPPIDAEGNNGQSGPPIGVLGNDGPPIGDQIGEGIGSGGAVDALAGQQAEVTSELEEETQDTVPETTEEIGAG